MLPYADEVKASLLKRWPASQFFALGHIGDGNLHFFVAPGRAAGDIAAQHVICDELVYRPLQRLEERSRRSTGSDWKKKAGCGYRGQPPSWTS